MKARLYRLLRRSEKYTKTDMLYITKGGFWLSVGYAIAIVSGFALTAAMANFIPPEVYGTYKFILAVSVIVGSLTLTGLATSVVRSIANGYEGTYLTAFKTLLRWNLIITISSAIVATYYFLNENNTLALAMLIVGCCAPLLNTDSLTQSFFAGKQLFREQTIVASIKSIVSALLLILTVYLTNNILIIIAVYFGTRAILAIAFYYFTIIVHRPNKNVDESAVTFSKHLSLMNFMLIFARQADKLILFHFLGPVQLATYALATGPITELKAPEKLLGKLALPKLSKLSVSDIKRTLPEKMRLAFALSFVMTLGYILLAPYVYTYIFPQYVEAIIYSQVFAVTLMFTPSLFFNQVFVAHQKISQLYKLRTIIPFFKIVLLLVLVPTYGLWGGIITLILNNTALFFLHLYYFYKL